MSGVVIHYKSIGVTCVHGADIPGGTLLIENKPDTAGFDIFKTACNGRQHEADKMPARQGGRRGCGGGSS